MNWMGGARSRIKIEEEKRRQKEFFSRKRQYTDVNTTERKEKVRSQDLLLFETIEKIFNDAQPKANIDKMKKVPHAEMKEQGVKMHNGTSRSKLTISPSYLPSILNIPLSDNCQENRPATITSKLLQNWCTKLNTYLNKENDETIPSKTGETESNKQLANPIIQYSTVEEHQDWESELFKMQNVVNYQASTSKENAICTNNEPLLIVDENDYSQTSRNFMTSDVTNSTGFHNSCLSEVMNSPIQGDNEVEEKMESQENERTETETSSMNNNEHISANTLCDQSTKGLHNSKHRCEVTGTPKFQVDSGITNLITSSSTPIKIVKSTSPIPEYTLSFNQQGKNLKSNKMISKNIISIPVEVDRLNANLSFVDKATQTDIFSPISQSCELGTQTDPHSCTCSCYMLTK